MGTIPPVVAPRNNDDIQPTRAIFLTTATPLDPRTITWPAGIPPLICFTVESIQRVRHYHTVLVFNYYSRTVDALAEALGVEYISATRVKTNYAIIRRSMLLQSVRVVDNIVNRREALGFVDHVRQTNMRLSLLAERQTLGNPRIYGRQYRRTADWQPPGFGRVEVDMPDLAHVWSGDVYRSHVLNGVANDYQGQTFVVMPAGLSPVAHVLVIAGAYVMIHPDDADD
jgi:hypothetical protein